jgi:hypothetical protein
VWNLGGDPIAAGPGKIGRSYLRAAGHRANFLVMRARLTVLDRVVPLAETPVDRAIGWEGERIRKAK